MTQPSDSERAAVRRGGPPRAGVLIGAGLVLIGLLLFAATRHPAPPPAPGIPAPAAETPGVAPGEPAPPSGPLNGPAANAPAPPPARNGPAPSTARSTPPPGNAPALPNPSDLPPGHPAISTDEKTQVSIQWLGYSCFYIQSPGGTAVVTDPFDPKVTGLASPATGAHLVTISTETPEHNNPGVIHAFPGETKQVLHGTGASRGDLRVIPVPTYRDDSAGARAGRNTVYVIEAGALRLAHLGDLGHVLTPQQVQAVGHVDVLMVPVGGALDPKEAVAVAKQLNPRVVIPMAYSTPSMDGPAARLPAVTRFVSASPYPVTPKDADVMLLSKTDLPATTEIYTLRYGH